MDCVGIYAHNIFDVASGYSQETTMSLEIWMLKFIAVGVVIPANKSEILHLCRKRDCCITTTHIRNTGHQVVNFGLIIYKKITLELPYK